MATLTVSGRFTATSARQQESDSFTSWQISMEWDQLPSNVRTATDSHKTAQIEIFDGNNEWAVSAASASPWSVEWPESTPSSYGGHANGVVGYYKGCAPTNTALRSYGWANPFAESATLFSGSNVFNFESNWGSPSDDPATAISDPGFRTVNLSANASGSGGNGRVAVARVYRQLQVQHNVLSVFSAKNGSPLDYYNQVIARSGACLIVASAEDSGANARDISFTATETSSKSDFDSASTTFSPHLTAANTTYDSYAAPAVSGALRRFIAYFNGINGPSKTATQIRTAVIETRHPSTRQIRLKQAYDLLSS